MAVKGRRLSRKSSNSTLVFAMFIGLSFLVLILLAFGVFSIPFTSRGSQKAHDLDDAGGKGDHWAEVNSWEPRAVVYHNFLSNEECGKGRLSVKPNMGDALLFWSVKPDASLDPSSLHGGCPVLKGNK